MLPTAIDEENPAEFLRRGSSFLPYAAHAVNNSSIVHR